MLRGSFLAFEIFVEKNLELINSLVEFSRRPWKSKDFGIQPANLVSEIERHVYPPIISYRCS